MVSRILDNQDLYLIENEAQAKVIKLRIIERILKFTRFVISFAPSIFIKLNIRDGRR